MYVATSTPAQPFTFAAELQDGQVITDPCDGATRTVTGEPTAEPHERVRIKFLGGVELLLWRHTPVDLVDMDQLHEQALMENTDVDPDLLARIAGLSVEELNMMVFGAWTDQVKAAVLAELHTRAATEYQTHYAGRDGHRAAYQQLTDTELGKRVTGEGIAGHVGGHGYRKTVALDELHARALVERAERADRPVAHEEALQVDALITLAMASAVDNTDPELGSVRDVMMDAIERWEFQTGGHVSGDVIIAATTEVTRRLA